MGACGICKKRELKPLSPFGIVGQSSLAHFLLDYIEVSNNTHSLLMTDFIRLFDMSFVSLSIFIEILGHLYNQCFLECLMINKNGLQILDYGDLF